MNEEIKKIIDIMYNAKEKDIDLAMIGSKVYSWSGSFGGYDFSLIEVKLLKQLPSETGLWVVLRLDKTLKNSIQELQWNSCKCDPNIDDLESKWECNCTIPNDTEAKEIIYKEHLKYIGERCKEL